MDRSLHFTLLQGTPSRRRSHSFGAWHQPHAVEALTRPSDCITIRCASWSWQQRLHQQRRCPKQILCISTQQHSPVSHRVKGLVHVEQPVGQWQPVRGHIAAHLQAESQGLIQGAAAEQQHCRRFAPLLASVQARKGRGDGADLQLCSSGSAQAVTPGGVDFAQGQKQAEWGACSQAHSV